MSKGQRFYIAWASQQSTRCSSWDVVENKDAWEKMARDYDAGMIDSKVGVTYGSDSLTGVVTAIEPTLHVFVDP